MQTTAISRRMKWPEFSRLYLEHASSYKRKVSISAVERPAVNAFGRFIGDKFIDEITRQDGEAFYKSMRSTMMDNSVRTRLVTLRGIFSWGISEKIVFEQPFAGIKKLPKISFSGRVLSDYEISLLLAHMDSDRMRRACVFALYTGMRKTEIRKLVWGSVRFDHVVIPQEIAKSGRSRTIMLHAEAIKAMGPRQAPAVRVFGLSYQYMNRHMKRACELSGLGRIRFHDFRHTAATRFFEQSDDVFAAMDSFGWASPASAVPYQHLTKKRQEKILGIEYKFKPELLAKGLHSA